VVFQLLQLSCHDGWPATLALYIESLMKWRVPLKRHSAKEVDHGQMSPSTVAEVRIEILVGCDYWALARTGRP
jgi:hypothetical protein